MNDLHCPSCLHGLFAIESDHAYCAKCKTVVRFNEIRKLISIQMGWGKDEILELFENQLEDLLEEIEEKNDSTAETSDR